MSQASCRTLSKGRFEFLMHLRVALKAYKPTGSAQARSTQEDYRQRMFELIEQGLALNSDPSCRDFFQPGHFTCSGFVLDSYGEHLLLVAHKKLKLWLQPGGHVEATDVTFLDAALREVTEETGVTGLQLKAPICDLDIHSIPAIGEEPAHLHYDVRVLYQATEKSAVDVLGGDERTRRFSLSEVAHCSGILHGDLTTDESVRRVCRQLSIQGK